MTADMICFSKCISQLRLPPLRPSLATSSSAIIIQAPNRPKRPNAQILSAPCPEPNLHKKNRTPLPYANSTPPSRCNGTVKQQASYPSSPGCVAASQPRLHPVSSSSGFPLPCAPPDLAPPAAPPRPFASAQSFVVCIARRRHRLA